MIYWVFTLLLCSSFASTLSLVDGETLTNQTSSTSKWTIYQVEVNDLVLINIDCTATDIYTIASSFDNLPSPESSPSSWDKVAHHECPLHPSFAASSSKRSGTMYVGLFSWTTPMTFNITAHLPTEFGSMSDSTPLILNVSFPIMEVDYYMTSSGHVILTGTHPHDYVKVFISVPKISTHYSVTTTFNHIFVPSGVSEIDSIDVKGGECGEFILFFYNTLTSGFHLFPRWVPDLPAVFNFKVEFFNYSLVIDIDSSKEYVNKELSFSSIGESLLPRVTIPFSVSETVFKVVFNLQIVSDKVNSFEIIDELLQRKVVKCGLFEDQKAAESARPTDLEDCSSSFSDSWIVLFSPNPELDYYINIYSESAQEAIDLSIGYKGFELQKYHLEDDFGVELNFKKGIYEAIQFLTTFNYFSTLNISFSDKISDLSFCYKILAPSNSNPCSIHCSPQAADYVVDDVSDQSFLIFDQVTYGHSLAPFGLNDSVLFSFETDSGGNSEISFDFNYCPKGFSGLNCEQNVEVLDKRTLEFSLVVANPMHFHLLPISDRSKCDVRLSLTTENIDLLLLYRQAAPALLIEEPWLKVTEDTTTVSKVIKNSDDLFLSRPYVTLIGNDSLVNGNFEIELNCDCGKGSPLSDGVCDCPSDYLGDDCSIKVFDLPDDLNKDPVFQPGQVKSIRLFLTAGSFYSLNLSSNPSFSRTLFYEFSYSGNKFANNPINLIKPTQITSKDEDFTFLVPSTNYYFFYFKCLDEQRECKIELQGKEPFKSCPNQCSNKGDCDVSTGNCRCFDGHFGDDCALSCGAGLFWSNGQCHVCERGFYNNQSAATTCLPCHNGHYCAGMGTITPSLCHRGTYTPNDEQGHRRCYVCETGTMAKDRGMSKCNNCHNGTHCPFSGMFRATPCSPGQFTPNDGKAYSSCLKCDEGFHNPVFGNTHCEPCNGGGYCDEKGLGEMKLCLPGSYSPHNNQPFTSCNICKAGFSAVEHGQSRCDACNSGTFCPYSNTSVPLPCPLGHFTPPESRSRSLNFTECIPCRINYYADEEGSDECNHCPVHHSNDFEGSSVCHFDEVFIAKAIGLCFVLFVVVPLLLWLAYRKKRKLSSSAKLLLNEDEVFEA
ncbi:hypothetical protein P9112_009118 [Eukaryota sp. TZLM1-RC]